jgi:hypothetical protein
MEYRRALEQFCQFAFELGLTRLDQLTPTHMEKYEAQLRESGIALKRDKITPGRPAKKNKSTSVHDKIKLVKSLAKWAVAMRKLQDNPISGYRLPAEGEGDNYCYTPVEVQAVCNHTTPFFGDVFRFLALTGLRQGELMWLAFNLFHNKELQMNDTSAKKRPPESLCPRGGRTAHFSGSDWTRSSPSAQGAREFNTNPKWRLGLLVEDLRLDSSHILVRSAPPASLRASERSVVRRNVPGGTIPDADPSTWIQVFGPPLAYAKGVVLPCTAARIEALPKWVKSGFFCFHCHAIAHHNKLAMAGRINRLSTIPPEFGTHGSPGWSPGPRVRSVRGAPHGSPWRS